MMQLDLFVDYAPRLAVQSATRTTDRQMRGRVNYLSGLAAEDIVARDYARRGMTEIARRWRGTVGEIDLICRNGDDVVIIEIKKSATFDRAAARLSRRQMDRIYATAAEFIGSEPRGQLTDVRLDLALVDAGAALRIVENAFWDA